MSIRKSSCVLLIASSMLFCGLPLFANDLKSKKVAGHLMVSRYDEKTNKLTLSNSNVIFQDRSGQYWIAASGKLILYDEKNNQWRTLAGESTFNRIETIIQSNDSRLWLINRSIATQNEPNLYFFDGGRWEKPESTSSPHFKQPVTAMFQSRDGRVWFAIKNGLVTYDGRSWNSNTRLSEAIAEDSPLIVRAGLQASDGYIWLATSEGIIRFDEHKQRGEILYPSTGKATIADAELSIYLRMAISDGIYRLYEDQRGRIWCASLAGSSGYHLVYDKSANSWSRYKLSDHLPLNLNPSADLGLTIMYQDKAGRMMFGTKKGLLTLNENENKWELFTSENSDLPGDSITTIYEDSSGRIWVGTNKGILVLEQ